MSATHSGSRDLRPLLQIDSGPFGCARDAARAQTTAHTIQASGLTHLLCRSPLSAPVEPGRAGALMLPSPDAARYLTLQRGGCEGCVSLDDPHEQGDPGRGAERGAHVGRERDAAHEAQRAPAAVLLPAHGAVGGDCGDTGHRLLASSEALSTRQLTCPLMLFDNEPLGKDAASARVQRETRRRPLGVSRSTLRLRPRKDRRCLAQVRSGCCTVTRLRQWRAPTVI